MAIYITQGKYTQKAMAGMLAKPEDRSEQVGGLMTRAGGKLLSYYVTTGEYDWMAISDMPDPVSMLSVLATAGAGGGVSDMKTTLAFSTSDAKAAFAKAGESAASFRSAGS